MKFISIIMITLLSFSSCKKEEFEITNLNGNKIDVLGHGGMGVTGTYPMNSVESILNCMHMESDGTEIDVQMTKDGVLVAFHDESFESRTNITWKLFQMNWENINGAIYTSPLMHGYKVVSLHTIFSALQNANKLTGKRFSLDCKNFNDTISIAGIEQYCNSLYALIDEFNLVDNVIHELQSDIFIDKIHSERPDLSIFVFQDVVQALEKAISSDLDGIVSSIDNITKEQISYAHANNIMVTLFNTQSNQRNIDAIEMNPDFIETDRLEHLISVLK